MTSALVIGGAACVWDDLAGARELFTPDIVIAANTIAIEIERVDHWVSYHPGKFAGWLERRRKRGFADPALWAHQSVKPGPDIKEVEFEKGTSGLLATIIALRNLQAERIVLAGVPMTPEPFFDGPDGHSKKWVHHLENRYRGHWLEAVPELVPVVRSMSGFTQELLGAPTREWLGAEAV